tara:strand:- start:5935 stop:6171 length:237 start_codon:yes stop_codon:yes gene_type:complete
MDLDDIFLPSPKTEKDRLYNVLYRSLKIYGRIKLVSEGPHTQVCYVHRGHLNCFYPQIRLEEIREIISQVRFDVKNGR